MNDGVVFSNGRACDGQAARTGLEIVMWDERLSTVSAMSVLKEGGVRREDRKQYVDKLAASLILQGYLDLIHGSEEKSK